MFDRLRKEFDQLPFSTLPDAKFNTDDFNFFDKCRKLGIKCWCAPHIEAKHLTITGYGLDDYDQSCAPTGSTVMREALA